MSAFLSELDTRLEDDAKGLFRLLAPLDYQSDVLKKTIAVPAGFVTDFASGPMFGLFSVGRDIGRPIAAVHDWLYTTQSVTRSVADQVLREGMLVLGYSDAVATAFYLAVRAGGWYHWRKPDNPQPVAVREQIARVYAARFLNRTGDQKQ